MKKAIVDTVCIARVFQQFKELRFTDETIYLRAASLNIVNGMVGLNFSCDGSHYMHYEEFLEKSMPFWFGG
jgi:ABC-type siderophore export system fused ATPase/permease subunit